MRTGGPESALSSSARCARPALSTLGRPSDEIQQRAAQGE
jgi:hypothetical protein